MPTTGIAGLTLGGGIGCLWRYGLAADNLLSADLVTAEGKLVTVSTRENEDLFWGLRGGGGNFGVVTSFEFQLHRVGEILGGMVLHAIDDAPDVIAFVANFAREAPDELVLMIVLVTGLDGSRVCGVAVCYNGDHTEGVLTAPCGLRQTGGRSDRSDVVPRTAEHVPRRFSRRPTKLLEVELPARIE